MRAELLSKSVLAMYDVRGIQSYIFSTNKVRDIIGASNLVENIIINGLRSIVEKNSWSATQYLLDWENDVADAFLNDENVKMQVLFVGGGNAYVLYRNGETCEIVNRALAKYVLDETYSLNLAVAVVEKTDSYYDDYNAINEKMRDIKAVMPQTKPMGAFPFMPTDSMTGYPLSKKVVYNKDEAEYISTESKLKRNWFGENDDERILDNMVTEKGSNSVLAVIHIDGNNVGSRIKDIMQKDDNKKYTDAIPTMRAISKNLKYEFMDCYNKMTEKLDALSSKIKKNSESSLYRKIIVAGDDITFICNAKMALYATKIFLDLVVTKSMYEKDGKVYPLSACAGIAFCNSHFPFSDAYEVAEACCASAKRSAKKLVDVDEREKCYADYQICKHIKAKELDLYRTEQYTMVDGKSMVFRPYSKDDIEAVLYQNIKVFKDKDGSRNKYKKLRNAFSAGEQAVNDEKVFLESRHIALPNTNPDTWYDALEIMDIFEWEDEK